MNTDRNVTNRQERIKAGAQRHTAGRRWSTAHRKQEFLELAREEEIAVKETRRQEAAAKA